MSYRDGTPALWARVATLERERAGLQVKLGRLSQRHRRHLRRRILRWMLILVTASFALVVVVRAVAFAGRFECRILPTHYTRSSEKALHAIVEAWRANHGNQCPTLARLVQEGELAASADLHDAWGQPYVLVCTDDATLVGSSGQDRVLYTADDVLVPDRPVPAPWGF